MIRAITTNQEFTSLVEKATKGEGPYPKQVAVPLDEPFVNDAGCIQNLAMERFTSVALIQSKRGSVRANHWHRTDWHYTYVLSGKVEYFQSSIINQNEKALYSLAEPEHFTFAAGEMFFTAPWVQHAMFFPQDSTILTLANNIRDTDHHEKDVVRKPLIAVRGGVISGTATLDYEVHWVNPDGVSQLISQIQEPLTYV